MAESGASSHPTPGKFIKAGEVSEHLDKTYEVEGRWIYGLDLTFAGLDATFDSGEVAVAGKFVTFDDPVTKTLTPSATNYVYADKNADILVNTNGIPPADSVPLYELVTNGSTITGGTLGVRDDTVSIDRPHRAVRYHVTDEAVTDANQLVPRSYIDSVVQGTSVSPCRVATTAAGTLASSFENGDTVDGVVLVTGDRILVKNQTAGAENGVRIVAASGAPPRASDFDTAAEVKPGSIIVVSEGTTNADTSWILETNAPITVDATALTFGIHSVRGQRGTANGLATLTAGVHTLAERPAASTTDRGDILVGTAVPAALGAAAVGASTTRAAREDHVHPHGAQASDGTMHAAATPSVAGFESAADKTKLDSLPAASAIAPTSRNLTAGAGLTGGGDLSADRTFNVVADPDGSLVVAADSMKVGILATDAQHGVRGGGTQHAAATGAVAGFLSAADKTKLDAATSAPTASTIMSRDAFGRSQVANPVAAQDAVPLGYFQANFQDAIDKDYAIAADDWVQRGTIIYSASAGPSNLIGYNGIYQKISMSASPAAVVGIFSSEAGWTSTNTQSVNEAWDAGDKLEYIEAIKISAFSALAANQIAGICLYHTTPDPIGNLAAACFSKTDASLRRIAVGVDSTGAIFIVTCNGSSVTATNTGFTYTPGAKMKIKLVYTVGSGVVVTVDANAPTNVILTPPDRLAAYSAGAGGLTFGTATMKSYRGGWRMTVA